MGRSHARHGVAALEFFDATGGTKAELNENLGRELLELFTLVEGHYT